MYLAQDHLSGKGQQLGQEVRFREVPGFMETLESLWESSD